MAKRNSLLFWLFLALLSGAGSRAIAQDNEVHIRVNVDLVQLNVAVTDNKGNYITGLRPQDFAISEDRIPEKIATFGEGTGPTQDLADAVPPDSTPLANGASQPVLTKRPNSKGAAPGSQTPAPAVNGSSTGAQAPLGSMVPDANVFILFDTSDYMYRGFVFAQDAIADFVRSLETASKVAFYSYSRDLSRNTPLTSDRSVVLRGVRSAVAGDEAALYNCLLLTVKDAAKYTGRKIVVVFSNGPDNSSLVPPEDVAELAQSTGTVIYMISTRQAQIEPISTAVFERMSKATGGKAYFARNWQDESRAFSSIIDDLAHLYAISYYPQPNPTLGWRTITVKLVGNDLKKYHIRTRNGYRLQATQITSNASAENTGTPGSSAVPSTP
jgi:Ca-activated chloride channel homolog